MNTTGIIFAARDSGVELSVTKDDNIQYAPKSKMPGWLLAEIRTNKEPLLRDLLLRDALRYLAQHYIEGADLSVLDPYEDLLNEAHGEGTLEDLREAVRAYVRAGREEFQRAKRKAAA